MTMIPMFDKQPSFGMLKQLLTEIEEDLAKLCKQQYRLKKVSEATFLTVRATMVNVKETNEKLSPDLQRPYATSLQRNLDEALGFLNNLLDKIQPLLDQEDEASRNASLLVQQVKPIMQKVKIAAQWLNRLFN